MLFVSHADKDNDRIDELCDHLHAAGIETWVDHQNGLTPGDHFNHKIQEAVNTCDAGLFVLTPNSAASNYCEAEWMRLIALKKKFYVALLDPVPLSDFPLLLGTIQYADLVKDYSAGINALIRAVGGKIPLDAGDAAVKTGKRMTQNYDDRYSTYSIPMQGREADLAKALDDLKQAPLFIVGRGRAGQEPPCRRDRAGGRVQRRGVGACERNFDGGRNHPPAARTLRLEAITPPEKVIERVRQDGRLLVVIDNAEAISDAARPEFEKLADQLAQARAAVMVTTRVADWTVPRRKRSCDLWPLQPEEGARVVRAMAEDQGIEGDTTPFAEELAKAARFHPRLIELAVSKLNYDTPAGIVRELNDLTSPDTGDALTEMFRNTAAQMDTHDPGAKATLRQLAVCRGGFTREAAQAISGLDEDALRARLKTLIDYRFVRFDLTSERYSVDELVRVAVGEDEDARRAHFNYYRDHAKAVGGDQTKHDRYQKLEIESENLDAAFAWALAADPAQAYWLANACTDFLANRGRYADRMTWFSALEGRAAAITDEYTRAALYNSLGVIYQEHPFGGRAANLRRAVAAYEEALRFYTAEAAPLDYAMTQNNLGAAYADLAAVEDRAANLRRAIAAYEQALRFRTAEAAPLAYAMTQNNLGTAYCESGGGRKSRRQPAAGD